MKDNQYNQSSKDKFCNSSVNFCESQHEIQPSEREAALERIQQLVDHTKATIQDHV